MRILLTAFEPYGEWSQNSSWLAMMEILRQLPTSELELTTRRYPVGLDGLTQELHKDLEKGFDAVLNLGQSPGTAAIKLEKIALNVAGLVEEQGEELPELVRGAPIAFRSQMPVGKWAGLLRESHIPAVVSYHAGTFLCNATMYLAHHWHYVRRLETPVGFIHLPLATEQVAERGSSMPSLPVKTLAAALLIVLRDLAKQAADQQDWAAS